MSLKKLDCLQETSTSIALFRAICLRDRYTGDHSDHVAQIVTHFADIYPKGFQGREIDLLSVAARIHDIGKIGISDHILRKPGKYSKDEYEVMKKHPQMGHDLIDPLLSNQMVGDVVLYHHENYDGSGYPKGLKGTEIPLAARLVRIADYYGALTTDRAYRPALEPERAIQLMMLNSQCFDPELFSFFINNLENIIFYSTLSSSKKRGNRQFSSNGLNPRQNTLKFYAKPLVTAPYRGGVCLSFESPNKLGRGKVRGEH